MTTLIGNEVYSYLDHLVLQASELIEQSKAEFDTLAHTTFRDVMKAEKRFLQQINQIGTQPMLSITEYGMPSIDTINPDLEKMKETGIVFRSPQGLQINYLAQSARVMRENYVQIEASKFKKVKDSSTKQRCNFSVSNDLAGKFNLNINQEVFVAGYDELSKTMPLAISRVTACYFLTWNKLQSKTNTDYNIAKQQELVVQPQGIYNNLIYINMFSNKTEASSILSTENLQSELESELDNRRKISNDIITILRNYFPGNVMYESDSKLERALKFDNINLPLKEYKINQLFQSVRILRNDEPLGELIFGTPTMDRRVIHEARISINGNLMNDLTDINNLSSYLKEYKFSPIFSTYNQNILNSIFMEKMNWWQRRKHVNKFVAKSGQSWP